MELARGYRPRDQNKIKHSQNGGMGLNSDTFLVIKLPDSQVLRVLSRSLFLATVIVALPCIGSILRGLYASSYDFNVSSAYDSDSDLIDVGLFDVVWQDLANEGLIKKGDKALIISSGIGAVIDGSRFLNANEIDLVLESELEQEALFPNASFDFAFAFGSEDVKSLDRFVKVGGILVTELNNDPQHTFQKQSNYKIVYLRRYDSTIVAMRKTSAVNQAAVNSSAKRRLCQLALEAKKAALQGLEDVLLEPPRRGLVKSRQYLKQFRFLPDLLGDSLENYPRRVFVDAGLQEEKNDVIAWFNENYPRRNQEFELYNIELVTEGVPKRAASGVDVSNWLMQNVREDEFVVMKAEADVVEEILKSRTVGLVDELFLECSNQWQTGKRKKSKRAYWECLALYGRLRDEGVAVHQWWG